MAQNTPTHKSQAELAGYPARSFAEAMQVVVSSKKVEPGAFLILQLDMQAQPELVDTENFTGVLKPVFADGHYFGADDGSVIPARGIAGDAKAERPYLRTYIVEVKEVFHVEGEEGFDPTSVIKGTDQ